MQGTTKPKDPAPAESNPWRKGRATSFADPADIRAFKRCKAQGKTDQECFKVGDNGIGKWGADTTQPRPMCALPPEDWQHLRTPNGTAVEVQLLDPETHEVKAGIVCELRDTMPHKRNIKNDAVIDLNEEAWKMFGKNPPCDGLVQWRWA